MTTDESALRKAARENPTDESYRLLLADYLCENGRERDGILERVHAQPDNDDWREQYATWCERNGDPVRAELIHVQVALDAFRRGPCDVDLHKEYKHRLGIIDGGIRCREHELLAGHTDRWRKGPICPDEKCIQRHHVEQRGKGGHSWGCELCHDTGDAGGLIRCDLNGPRDGTEWEHEVTYHRGMKRVHATLAECVGVYHAYPPGQYGDNDWYVAHHPSDWLRSVLIHHQDVVEARMTDREPWGGPGMWGWAKTRTMHNDQISEREEIPPAIWELLNGHRPLDNSGWKRFDNRELALTVLARTIVQWGRSFL